MPKIRWVQLPQGVRDHLLERLHERKVTIEDLHELKRWIETDPEAPKGRWFKDFGTFKVCGEGELPLTFLLKGQTADGEAL